MGFNMHCVWTFLRDEQNRAIVGWLAYGIPIVSAGIWIVIKFVFYRIRFWRMLVGISATIIALLGVSSAGLYAIVSQNCPDCARGNIITLRIPKGNSTVGTRVPIVGWATPHPLCRTVNVFVHDLSSHDGNGWKPAHTTQTDKEGNWSAVAFVDYVTAGEQFQIRAYLSDEPVLLSGCDAQSSAMNGLPSLDITLWRQ